MRKSHAVLWATLALGSIGAWAACSSDDTTSPANSGGTGGGAGSRADAGGTGGTGGKSGSGGTGGTGGATAGTGGTGGSTADSGGTGGTGGSTQDAGPDQDAASDAQADADAGTDAATSCIGSDAALNDADIAAGMDLVLTLGCPKCHQTQPADAGLVLSGKVVPDASVFPKNLTPDPETGIGCWTDEQIQNAILNAIDDKDASLCGMPKFATKLDGGPVAPIVAFLRSLPPVHNEIPLTNCPPPSDGGTDAADAGTPTDAGDGG